ncbi:hypothetical protein SCARD494_09952 [Seiridium cardinale]
MVDQRERTQHSPEATETRVAKKRTRSEGSGSCVDNQKRAFLGSPHRDALASPWDSPKASSQSIHLQNVDSRRKNQVLCAKILTARSMEPHVVRIQDDTGTDVNWIHPKLVERCGLERERCEAKRFRDFQGRVYGCSERVRVRWAGKENKSIDGWFLVAPGQSTVELVLGNEFVSEYGRANKFCDAEEVGDARILISDPASKQEQAKMKNSAAKAAEVKAELALSQVPGNAGFQAIETHGNMEQSPLTLPVVLHCHWMGKRLEAPSKGFQSQFADGCCDYTAVPYSIAFAGPVASSTGRFHHALRMSGHAEPETRPIGEGVDPGGAKVGTICWAVEAAIRETLRTEHDPLKAAARRDLVTKFDFAQGWTICPDYIDDCFNDLKSESVANPSQHEVGAMLWVIDLAIRETVANGEDPGKTAKRRELIMGMEITKGKEVNRDDIADFFTNATDHGTTRPYRPPPAEHESVTSTESSYGTKIFSNGSSSIHLDPTEAFQISLRSDEQKPKNDDIVMARYHDAEKNYVTNYTADRQKLKRTVTAPFEAEGIVRVSINGLFDTSHKVLFHVKRSIENAEVLFGKSFQSSKQNMERWNMSTRNGKADGPWSKTPRCRFS